MSKPMTLLAAILYGVCWVVLPLNLYAATLLRQEGGDPLGLMPTIMLSSGIILLVHARNGWFPFQRPR